MPIHVRETTIGRKFTEEEAAHIERGAVCLLQAENNKMFVSFADNKTHNYWSLKIEDVDDIGWKHHGFAIPNAGFEGVDDSLSNLFVRFATEEECKRFDMPYIPMPKKSTHLKVVGE